MAKLLLRVALLAAAMSAVLAARRPVVLLHGLLGTAEAMSHIKKWVNEDMPDVFVHNAEIPKVGAKDAKLDSLLIPMNQQVADFAKEIQAIPQLANGFDLVCHSQGTLTCRGFIERYGTPRVHNYISLAGPQMGVFGLPDLNDWCPDADCPWMVDFMNKVSEHGSLEAFFQTHISFSQYWKNPLNYTAYLESSGYLADINNERSAKNATYKANLVNITGKMFLAKALRDHIVVPKESEWFGFYTLGQDTATTNMTGWQGYQEDWIGLRTLNEAGRISMHACNCTHQDMPRPQCKSEVYEAVVKPNIGGQI